MVFTILSSIPPILGDKLPFVRKTAVVVVYHDMREMISVITQFRCPSDDAGNGVKFPHLVTAKRAIITTQSLIPARVQIQCSPDRHRKEMKRKKKDGILSVGL